MEDFLEKEEVVKVTTGKKRKRETKEDNSVLKQKARLYCKCPEQWRSVSRYSDARLQQFIEEQEFLQQKQMFDSVFGFIHTMLGKSLDTVLGGRGHIEDEITSDVSLRQAIELEGGNFIKLLTNKLKIVALATIDAANGKQKEKASRPIETLVEEENEQDRSEEADNDGAAVWHEASGEEERKEGEQQI